MVELAIAAEFPRCDPGQAMGSKALRERFHETFPINCPVAPLLLKLDNAIPDEPVPQGQPDIDGLDCEFARLLDLVPLERGASGRLKALRVVTDAGEFVLGKELAIRLALSPTCLYSALVFFTWEGDTLRIHGKGWGHGVGLCQLGATRMAQEGHDWRAILMHYYPDTQLVSIVDPEIL